MGFAALRDPESIALDFFKNATLGLLIYATVRAAWNDQQKGAGWMRFAVFAWANWVGQGEGNPLREWILWQPLKIFLADRGWDTYFERVWPGFNQRPRGYLAIHFVMTRIIGVAGAILLRFLASSREGSGPVRETIYEPQE